MGTLNYTPRKQATPGKSLDSQMLKWQPARRHFGARGSKCPFPRHCMTAERPQNSDISPRSPGDLPRRAAGRQSPFPSGHFLPGWLAAAAILCGGFLRESWSLQRHQRRTVMHGSRKIWKLRRRARFSGSVHQTPSLASLERRGGPRHNMAASANHPGPGGKVVNSQARRWSDGKEEP